MKHLTRETFSKLKQIDGFVQGTVLRRSVDDGVEFLVVTYWKSLDHIESFAGEDIERAVVPPVARSMMVRYDETVCHYEVVSEKEER